MVDHLDGKSLGFALEKELSKIFLELAIMCKAVICCMSLVPLDQWLIIELKLYRSCFAVAKGPCS